MISGVVDKIAPGTGLGSVITEELKYLGDMNSTLNSMVLTPSQKEELRAAERLRQDAGSGEDRYADIYAHSTAAYQKQLAAERLKYYVPGATAPLTPGKLPDIATDGTKAVPKSESGISTPPRVNAALLMNEMKTNISNAINTTTYGKAFKQYMRMLKKVANSPDITDDEYEGYCRYIKTFDKKRNSQFQN